MARYQLKTTLTALQAVELILDRDFDSILRNDPDYKTAHELYECLIEEYEIAINCAENSIIKISLPPTLGVSDAQASKQSLATFFRQNDNPNYAKLIMPQGKNGVTDDNGLSHKPHGNALRNNKVREEVLEFALYVIKKFPDQCESAAKWAQTIDEKAQLKWPDTAEPPLARATIEKLLGKALKDTR